VSEEYGERASTGLGRPQKARVGGSFIIVVRPFKVAWRRRRRG